MHGLNKEKTKPLLVVIAGPTASGKTNVAIKLAQHFNTEILSCDSRQCYREMDIGVAKPLPEELALVPHHFINSHSIHESVDAAVYERYGLRALEKIFTHHKIAIAVGGTGLYLKALCEGVDPMPEIPDEIRNDIRNLFEKQGLPGLHEKLKITDADYFSKGEILNPQRVMRALEISLFTGKSILTLQTRQAQERPFRILYLGMNFPREILYQRINQRVDEMVETGLADEVKALLPYGKLNALQTVGYTELFNFYDGKLSLSQAVDKIKQHTRNYAKRQITWFKKINGMHWLAPDEISEMVYLINEKSVDKLKFKP
jgi:tRNA dimethylallyltransferase